MLEKDVYIDVYMFIKKKFFLLNEFKLMCNIYMNVIENIVYMFVYDMLKNVYVC